MFVCIHMYKNTHTQIQTSNLWTNCSVFTTSDLLVFARRAAPDDDMGTPGCITEIRLDNTTD